MKRLVVAAVLVFGLFAVDACSNVSTVTASSRDPYVGGAAATMAGKDTSEQAAKVIEPRAHPAVERSAPRALDRTPRVR